MTCLAAGLRPSGSPAMGSGASLPVLASGSRGGTVDVWAGEGGGVIQSIDLASLPSAVGLSRPASAARSKGFFGETLKRTATVVTGLTLCPEGLLSCAMDGAVRLHPLAG